jgi:hypothetical protein
MVQALHAGGGVWYMVSLVVQLADSGGATLPSYCRWATTPPLVVVSPLVVLLAAQHSLTKVMQPLLWSAALRTAPQVPNLMGPDDMDAICNAMRPLSSAAGLPATKQGAYTFFVDRHAMLEGCVVGVHALDISPWEWFPSVRLRHQPGGWPRLRLIM